jgi:hypothetical protein
MVFVVSSDAVAKHYFTLAGPLQAFPVESLAARSCDINALSS